MKKTAGALLSLTLLLTAGTILVSAQGEKTETGIAPETMAIYCEDDVRTVSRADDGMYYDEEENAYEALASFTTFIRTSDQATYYDAVLQEEEEPCGPKTMQIICDGDRRTVWLAKDGMYYDDEENAYEPLASFTTFIRTSDQATYYDVATQNIDPKD